MVKSWDRGVEFEALKARLESLMRRSKTDKEYAYAAILLTQLLNGSRVSEAVDAVLAFARSGERRVKVRVRKRKEESERLMVVPERVELRRVAWLVDEEPRLLVRRVKMYALNKLRVNTHSLRYAFITHLARRGISAQIIAKITGHRRLDYILHYTQRVEAEKLLEKIVEEA